MTDAEKILRELRKLREAVETSAAASASQAGAVKRKVAAKMMGIGPTKLDALVKAGRVATAEDSRLIPLAEVRRYCAPKPKRQRRPAVGHRVRLRNMDGTSDEALEVATRAIASRRAGP